MNRNIGIHTPDSFRGGLCFSNAQQGNFGQQLTVQIGGLKYITVHHPHRAYANAGKHIDEMPAQTAAANHQNTFAPKQLAFRFAQGGDIARISGIHRSAASHRGKQSHDIPVHHFRFWLVMKTVDEQNRHFFLGNVHPVKDIPGTGDTLRR